MKKICCIILFVACSQMTYGQMIQLDSTIYYSLITKGEWIQEGAELDGSMADELSKIKIDSNYYWSPDGQITIVMHPLSYELNIYSNMFILRVKYRHTTPGMKSDFYIYGWFVDFYTLKIIRSQNKIKFSKIKKATPITYKAH